jgi:hypothetical protein
MMTRGRYAASAPRPSPRSRKDASDGPHYCHGLV